MTEANPQLTAAKWILFASRSSHFPISRGNRQVKTGAKTDGWHIPPNNWRRICFYSNLCCGGNWKRWDGSNLSFRLRAWIPREDCVRNRRAKRGEVAKVKLKQPAPGRHLKQVVETREVVNPPPLKSNWGRGMTGVTWSSNFVGTPYGRSDV